MEPYNIEIIVKEHGVPFYNQNQPQTVEMLSGYLTSEQPVQYVTLTIGMFLEALREPDFHEIISNSIAVPESTGLRWFSAIVPPKMPRVPGGDTIRLLVNELVQFGKPLVLVGSTQENRQRVAAVFGSEVPDLKVIVIEGEHNFDDPVESEKIAKLIHGIQPGLTLVACDEIRGPRWIDKYLIKPKLGSGVVVSGGQTIDVWACVKTTPPKLARDLGFGWLIRMFLEKKERRNRYLEVFKELIYLTVSRVLVNNHRDPLNDLDTSH